MKMGSGQRFEACCNAHDTCYGTAGRTQAECDQEFAECLRATIEGLVDELTEKTVVDATDTDDDEPEPPPPPATDAPVARRRDRFRAWWADRITHKRRALKQRLVSGLVEKWRPRLPLSGGGSLRTNTQRGVLVGAVRQMGRSAYEKAQRDSVGCVPDAPAGVPAAKVGV